ncbi:thioredoxin domain-containing protein [Thiohalocapsa marina]|uniref:Thioredoxin domain-containing protein n=1 Tax=Thiohalocapsa marina TaxID=424902 RepID=A0A5M8FCS4_9GAMM|nr:thioredoxin domain-containing protein [Thiohalocapsa marina]KAA6182683.1 thioredoxin domain-containing protein [Thiohalocapsa marina]
MINQTAGGLNRLAESTSPYLQQHAGNPVDWWPWCDEALTLARQQDRPILLSIGYSACHWCHVMAHESFEDPATAEVMNRLFVNIKVDREERPDLDKIYQTAHQLLARRAGGWPLTVFLTPTDLKPFFAGTYFPPEPRHGLPAFTGLLEGIAQAYHEQRDAIATQNASLMEALEQLQPVPAASIPDAAPLEGARRQLASSFDRTHGGFGQAPKFPHPANLEFLLRHWAATVAHPDADDQPDGDPNTTPNGPAADGDVKALHMALFTLERMIRGGVNDQLGGGFCRYSVDDQWMIPHFEKMLYDNGPLLALCCDAWQITADPLFHDAACATADWVLAEMQAPEGGYYSALDADSEGEEGKFYVWTPSEVAAMLEPDEYALIAPLYGLDQPPNFEGRWHLHGYRTLAEVAAEQGIAEERAQDLLRQARTKLLAARAGRARPGRDEKVLTAWNALMIKAMARAGRVLGRPDYLASAERALDFIRKTLWRDGRLLASYKDGTAHLMAYLDDHAFLLDALLELLQTRWRRDDLDWAMALADLLLAQFHDAERGGFHFIAADHEALIQRPKPLGDEAMPSGNGIAAQALQRLGHLLGEPRYLQATEGTLRLAAESMQRIPYAHASLLAALDEHLQPPETLVIRGPADQLPAWQAAAQRGYRPRRLVLAIPAQQADLPGALGDLVPGDTTRAYRCWGTRCEAPLETIEALAEA